MSKIYSPSGLVVGSTREYVEVHARGATFAVCVRCGGTGHRTYDVAPWVAPVATVPAGCSEAEVEVQCDMCTGSGLVRV